MAIEVTKNYIETLFSIKDKVAIVTGATGALGSAMAMGYAHAGAKVVLTGRNEKKLQDVATAIKAAGGECAVCVADPSD